MRGDQDDRGPYQDGAASFKRMLGAPLIYRNVPDVYAKCAGMLLKHAGAEALPITQISDRLESQIGNHNLPCIASTE